MTDKLINTLILFGLCAYSVAQSIQPITCMPEYNGGSLSFQFAAAETKDYYYLASPQFYEPKCYVASWEPTQNKTFLAPFSANAPVYQVISDGKDGFFIAGDFTQINGKYRPYLAHLNNDFSFDEAWNPILPTTLLEEIELWKNSNPRQENALLVKLSNDGHLNILCNIDQTYDGSFIVHNPPTSVFWRLKLLDLTWVRVAETPNAKFVPTNNATDLYLQSTLHKTSSEHAIEVYSLKNGKLTKWKTIEYKIAQCPPACFVHNGVFHSVGATHAADSIYWRTWNAATGEDDAATASYFKNNLQTLSKQVNWYLPQEPSCENCSRLPLSFCNYTPLPNGGFYLKNYVYYPQAYNKHTATAFVWAADKKQFYEMNALNSTQIDVKQASADKYFAYDKQNARIQRWDLSENKLYDFWTGVALLNNKHNNELGYSPRIDWAVNTAGQLLLVGDFKGGASEKFSSLLRLRKSDFSIDENEWNPLKNYIFTDLYAAGGKIYAHAKDNRTNELYLVCLENPDDALVEMTTKQTTDFLSFEGNDQTYLYWSEIALGYSPFNNILCRKRIADKGFKKIEQHKFFGWVHYVSQNGNFWQLSKTDDYLFLNPLLVFKSKNTQLPSLQLPTQGLRYVLAQDSAHFYSFVSTAQGNKLSRIHTQTQVTDEFWIDNNYSIFVQQGFVHNKIFYAALNRSGRQSNLPIVCYNMDTRQTSFPLFTNDFQHSSDHQMLFPMQKGFFMLSNFEQLNGLQVPSGLAFVPYTLPNNQHLQQDTAIYAPDGIKLDYAAPFLAWNTQQQHLSVLSHSVGGSQLSNYTITLYNEQNAVVWKDDQQHKVLQKSTLRTLDFSAIPAGKYRLVLDLSPMGSADGKYVLPKLYYTLQW